MDQTTATRRNAEDVNVRIWCEGKKREKAVSQKVGRVKMTKRGAGRADLKEVLQPRLSFNKFCTTLLPLRPRGPNDPSPPPTCHLFKDRLSLFLPLWSDLNPVPISLPNLIDTELPQLNIHPQLTLFTRCSDEDRTVRSKRKVKGARVEHDLRPERSIHRIDLERPKIVLESNRAVPRRETSGERRPELTIRSVIDEGTSSEDDAL
jgi:hypothetical protein